MSEEIKVAAYSLPEGVKLGGKYRIVRFIGSGAFGCTYVAEHLSLGMHVAVKELFVREYCNRDGKTGRVTLGTEGNKARVERIRRKFVEEAMALSQMSHKGIVRVIDEFEERGTAYYVMDYIEGSSLRQILNKVGRLSEGRALRYIRQVCDALDYVHSRDRLHLDIKPENIMIDAEPEPDEEKGQEKKTITVEPKVPKKETRIVANCCFMPSSASTQEEEVDMEQQEEPEPEDNEDGTKWIIGAAIFIVVFVIVWFVMVNMG